MEAQIQTCRRQGVRPKCKEEWLLSKIRKQIKTKKKNKK